MGCSKSSSKREVYSNTTLPQERRKTLNRQPNFTPKTTGKRRTKTPEISRRKEIIKIWAETNERMVLWEDKQNDKPLARHINNNREKNQINKIRNEKEDTTIDNAEI